MSITSEWYNEDKTILIIKYDGDWTLEEYYKNYEVANTMLYSVDHGVVSIADFSTSGPLPSKFLSVGKHSERSRAENNLQIVIFGLNRYMEVIAGMFQRIFPRIAGNMKIVSSLEEALDEAHATLSQTVQK
jgi:hypothetical protein